MAIGHKLHYILTILILNGIGILVLKANGLNGFFENDEVGRKVAGWFFVLTGVLCAIGLVLDWNNPDATFWRWNH